VFWIVVLRLADICVLEYMETMMSVIVHLTSDFVCFTPETGHKLRCAVTAGFDPFKASQEKI